MSKTDSNVNKLVNNEITFGVIGGGVIGGGWVARFLLMGFDVNVFDTDPQAQRKIKQMLENARRLDAGSIRVSVARRRPANFLLDY